VPLNRGCTDFTNFGLEGCSPILIQPMRTISLKCHKELAASPHYKWIALGLLFLASALNYADRGAITAVFPLLKKDLGMSDVALAATGSFFLWSYALASPLAGYLGDRFPRNSVIIWGLVAWSLVTIMTGFVYTAKHVLATRVLLGLAESLYFPAAIALIAELHSSRTQATAMGIHLSGVYVGAVAGGTLTGYVSDKLGWRLSFFILGGASLILGLVCRAFLFEGSREEGSRTGELATKEPSLPVREVISYLLKIPSYLFLLGEAMLLAIASMIFMNWLPLYFSETFRMSLAGAGFSGTFLIQAGAVLGILGGGFLSDRVASHNAKYRMLFQCLCDFMAAPFLLIFITLPNYALVAACLLFYSLVRGVGGANANPLTCLLVKPRMRSTAFGLANMANCFAGGAGILIAGYLKQDFGLGLIFAAVSGIVTSAGILLLIGYLRFLSMDLQRTG
jgi:MFS family permease